MRRLALALLIGGLGALAAPAPAWGVDIFVNSTDDEPDAAVDGICDSDPSLATTECTLRAAVQTANSVGGVGELNTIHIPNLGADYDLVHAGQGEDLSATGDLDIRRVLRIQGSGRPVIDGAGLDRVLHVGPNMTHGDFALVGVEVRDGGGVEKGAGILVERGAVSLSRVTVAGNQAVAVGNGEGAGIWFDWPVYHTIESSTISGNTNLASGSALGGGIGVGPGASVVITNSSISENVASAGGFQARGGGIFSSGGVALHHVSMQSNTTSGPSPLGGNLYGAGGSFSMRASILSAGIADPGAENCASGGGVFVSSGANLEAPTLVSQCGLGAADKLSSSAGLAALADRGGTTFTHALLNNSPALDAVPSCFPLQADQRQLPRPSGTACDIGSFERQVAPPPGEGCFGKKPTFVGGTGANRIVGTPKNDVISGGGGRDVIKGEGGKDLICGGKGDDKIIGGSGDDRIAGDDGKDRLYGKAGKDLLRGNAGRDLLDGGTGADVLNGGGSNKDNCRGRDREKNC